MGVIEGILLGAIQGISEFLPISSSGHLALFGEIILPDAMSMDLFTEVFLHLGTLGAVIIIFAREVFSVFLSPFTGVPRYRAGGLTALCAHTPLVLLGLVLLASVPAGIMGVLFNHEVEKIVERPAVVALLLACTGIILLATEYVSKRRERNGSFSVRATGGISSAAAPAVDNTGDTSSKTVPSVRNALFIGLAQAAAIFPGLSRSGLTISAARLCGLQRKSAGVFSFLLFVPAIAGASLLQILKLIKALRAETLTESLAEIPGALAAANGGTAFMPAYHIAGFISAFVFGLLALTLLMKLLKTGRFHIFGWYCLAAALLWTIAL